MREKRHRQALLCAAIVLLTSFSAVHTTARSNQPVALVGTSWIGADSDGDRYEFNFMEDGILAYTSPSGSYTNGRWFQSGGSVYFHMNDHYSEYLGQFCSEIMQGKAWNVTGKKWTWSVRRVK